MEVIAVWVGLCLLVGYVAGQKGRSAGEWFLLSILLSPLLGMIAVLFIQSKVASATVDVRPAWMASPPTAPDHRPSWMVPVPAVAPPTRVSAPADALQSLVDMRDRGLITTDEFGTKKAELLARI